MAPLCPLLRTAPRRGLQASNLVFLLHRHQPFSTGNQLQQLHYTLSRPIYTVWGSNTDIGKTLVSTGLAASTLLKQAANSAVKFIYIKPLQTGFPTDSDSRFVFLKIRQLFHHYMSPFPLFASNHVLTASAAAANSVLGCSQNGEEPSMETEMMSLQLYEEVKLQIEGGEVSSELICKTMFAWREATSPHLAVEKEGGFVDDSSFNRMLQRCLELGLEDSNSGKLAWTLLETAGGVASPGPSGTLQCDLYRPFRLPAILVGDGRLGGISATVSAYESLNSRGYDVISIVLQDHGLMNEKPLLSYLRGRVPVLVLPNVPKDKSNNLISWFDESNAVFDKLKEIMVSSYFIRLEKLRGMSKRAGEVFWWPFTQHNLVPEETVTVIDSRIGENFVVYKKGQNDECITQQFDACASWWTQGPDIALQIELAEKVAYAAARYGHVMFPENVHEPALECADLLLQGVGRGWASRVFFSDNGSTAIEIALKMAFRKFCNDHEIGFDTSRSGGVEKAVELKVLAFRGCYHGDTLGAMEAQAPSSFTGFYQQPWYSGRGNFLDPPTIYVQNGRWNLLLPQGLRDVMLDVIDTSFSCREAVFFKDRDDSELAKKYLLYLSDQLFSYSESKDSSYIGALLIEPVILGAGGMLMVDPLFQRLLVRECRSRNIPVIFDEVFTGFWRLGVESAAELLGCYPDIACYGKLMTGGIIPLAATLARDTVFDAFVGNSKPKALLHGHSYTAHAIGCTAAATSIKWFKDPSTNPNLILQQGVLRELWDLDLFQEISSHPTIRHGVVLGTLCAFELKGVGLNAGYASLHASSLIRMMREDGVYTRPLGNVIYLMCGPCTPPHISTQVLQKFFRSLHRWSNL